MIFSPLPSRGVLGSTQKLTAVHQLSRYPCSTVTIYTCTEQIIPPAAVPHVPVD